MALIPKQNKHAGKGSGTPSLQVIGDHSELNTYS
jgi:hypothetical protein